MAQNGQEMAFSPVCTRNDETILEPQSSVVGFTCDNASSTTTQQLTCHAAHITRSGRISKHPKKYKPTEVVIDDYASHDEYESDFSSD